MNLDAGQRKELADGILATLEEAAPGSVAQLRGSLAEKTADVYSDIDILWEVPDSYFESHIDSIEEVLSKVHPIESLRSEPSLQNSKKRRLFFVRFRGIPLFWRLDLDVFAKSINRDKTYDLNNPDARGDDWSPAESALMNAIAAVKAHLRDKDELARQLLERAYERVGLECPNLRVRELILELVDSVKSTNPELRGLSGEIGDLVLDTF